MYQEDEDFPPALIIIDDMLPQLSRSQKSIFAKLFIGESRHRNIALYCLVQSYKAVPKTIRLQLTNLIVFPSNPKEAKLMYDEHSNKYEYNDWMLLYDRATAEKYSFLHINYDNALEDSGETSKRY